jgi:hypothetical protein
MNEAELTAEISEDGGQVHPPIPHACADPEGHRGPYRMVGPYEWDEMAEQDAAGWHYSRGWSRRYPGV